MLKFSEELPSCSRCRGPLLMSAVVPQTDAYGRPIRLELCASCDTGNTDRPAAGLFIQWFADGGGHDESRYQEGSQLMMEWTKECMAAHGWYLADTPPDRP
jgi:hypothetical protein